MDAQKNIETLNFGEHLTLDGYFGNPEKLNNKELVLECLGDLPEKLGMHKLCEPVIYFAEDNGIKDPGGWSGYTLIAESHIAIHTFTGRGFVSADVYTCKNGMDTGFIINYLKEKFELKEVETNLIKRGTRYPVNNIY